MTFPMTARSRRRCCCFCVCIHRGRTTSLGPDEIHTEPQAPVQSYLDGFGNLCCRFMAPAGRSGCRNDGIDRETRGAGPVAPDARSTRRAICPTNAGLSAGQPLLRDRPAVRDRLAAVRQTPPGWARVQAICDFVHNHVRFGYEHARADQDCLRGLSRAVRRLPRLRASGGHLLPLHEHPGALLHRLSRRHRRAAGLGPMDFRAWFEAYLGGRWYTFDARHNIPRIGRVLIGRGRDAADVPLSNSFGMTVLKNFTVVTEEIA